MKNAVPKQDINQLKEELTLSLKHIQRLNEALIDAKEKARESDNLKSAFLSNIRHEIYTPMNAIIGFSNILSTTMFSKVKTEKFNQMINISCKRLLNVLNDIIDISIIDADQIILNNELVNINILLHDIYKSFSKKVNNKNLKLIYLARPEFNYFQVETDLFKVRQVLCNLLNNAIKFTKHGEVKFGFDIKEDFMEFFVIDTGIGIAPENHSIIFDRFRQVDNSNARQHQGNGLGLTIAKALVEKLGGAITLYSELGKGSTFVFTIPYVLKTSIKENNNKLVEVNTNY